MGPESTISLLQFSDGLFPAGGHAHSFGLEYYVQAGIVQDITGVEAFIRAHLEGTLGPCDTVAMVSALDLGYRGDSVAYLALDSTLDAMKHVGEFREASIQMGHQTLRVASALTGDPMLHAFSEAVESGQTPGHHPVVFGLTGSVLRWTSHSAALAFLYSASAHLVGAALRLLPLGQLEGQRTLMALGPLIARLAGEAVQKGPDQLWGFTPGIEIAGMRHATMDSRLFRS